MIFARNGLALSISNPDPAIWGADDGTELWVRSDPTVSIVGAQEDRDNPGSAGIFSAFAFYFVSDPTNLIGIFGPGDQEPPPPQATIDFGLGQVRVAGVVVSTFTDLGTPIGFAYGYDHDYDVATAPLILSTDPSHPSHSTSGDAAATFPQLADLIGFEGPAIPPGESETTVLLAYEIVAGITPVPEPTSLLLLGCGLAALAGFGRKKFKRMSSNN